MYNKIENSNHFLKVVTVTIYAIQSEISANILPSPFGLQQRFELCSRAASCVDRGIESAEIIIIVKKVDRYRDFFYLYKFF